MKVASNIISKSAIWDFNITGGMVGTYSLNEFFKPGTVILYCAWTTLATVSGAAGATIAFGVDSIAVNALVTAQAAPLVFVGLSTRGVDFNTTPIKFPQSYLANQITATIGTADLTAGKILLSLVVIENPV